MHADIVYIHHNCFFLKLGPRTVLFDYPAPEHLPEAAAQAAAKIMTGADLTIFISHSHEDHFDPAILEATTLAASRIFVASDDVADLYPESLPDDAVIVEPGETYLVDGFRVETLESNDLGVAFCIEDGPVSIYYGGDLANWNWPAATAAALGAVERFWQSALARIARARVDIAFSNVDARLPSLAGGPEFVRVVAPRVFVPMHLFGRTRQLADLADRLAAPGTTIARYARPGDVFSVEL